MKQVLFGLWAALCLLAAGSSNASAGVPATAPKKPSGTVHLSQVVGHSISPSVLEARKRFYIGKGAVRFAPLPAGWTGGMYFRAANVIHTLVADVPATGAFNGSGVVIGILQAGCYNATWGTLPKKPSSPSSTVYITVPGPEKVVEHTVTMPETVFVDRMVTNTVEVQVPRFYPVFQPEGPVGAHVAAAGHWETRQTLAGEILSALVPVTQALANVRYRPTRVSYAISNGNSNIGNGNGVGNGNPTITAGNGNGNGNGNPTIGGAVAIAGSEAASSAGSSSSSNSDANASANPTQITEVTAEGGQGGAGGTAVSSSNNNNVNNNQNALVNGDNNTAGQGAGTDITTQAPIDAH